MRWLALLVALVACTARDDVATLHDEATAIAAYYRPVADSLEHRLDVVIRRGPDLHQVLPGSDTANASRRAAERGVTALRTMVGTGPANRGELVRRADALAAARDRASLAQLVDVSRDDIAADVRTINDELVRAEDWLVRAESIVRTTR